MKRNIVSFVTWVQFKQVHNNIHRCYLFVGTCACVYDSWSLTMLLNSRTNRFQFHTQIYIILNVAPVCLRSSPKKMGKNTILWEFNISIVLSTRANQRTNKQSKLKLNTKICIPEESEPSPLKPQWINGMIFVVDTFLHGFHHTSGKNKRLYVRLYMRCTRCVLISFTCDQLYNLFLINLV